MRDLNHLNEYRHPMGGQLGDKHSGAFILKIKGETYTVIASNGEGWDHVSIAHKHKIPSWSTMAKLKELFFEDHETVMQLHPGKADHINVHPNCLHLWRPQQKEIPMPPTFLV